MKRLLLLLFTTCLSSMLWAKDYLLVIDFTDGTEMTFALAKQPVITFADQIIRVKVGSRSSEFEMSDVVNFHFKEDPSDIRSPRLGEDFDLSWQGEDLMVISNATPDTIIRLYGVDGTFYPNRVNTIGDRVEISFSALPEGIYLLYFNNNRTIKIYRK